MATTNAQAYARIIAEYTARYGRPPTRATAKRWLKQRQRRKVSTVFSNWPL